MGTVGVIVGRFQVDIPHVGHRRLIEEVHRLHGKVLICLGVAPIRLAVEDPLDYSTRYQMMKNEFPWATITKIDDCPSDDVWSATLDSVVQSIYPTDKAIFYGSRDSFIVSYHGKWPVKHLDEIVVPSGTEVRRKIAETVSDSADFRKGVIYACSNRFPISYQVVDAAIVRESGGVTEVLLGKKFWDDNYRFIGGFVDPSDSSLEMAVKREVVEETSIETGAPVYLGSQRIDDWRYKGRIDSILSSFFMVPYVFGQAKASDDISLVRWVPADKLVDSLIKEHKPLGEMLLQYIKSVKSGS